MKKNIEKIEKKLKSKFYYDYEIYKHTWFKTGGKAYIFCLVFYKYSEPKRFLPFLSAIFKMWFRKLHVLADAAQIATYSFRSHPLKTILQIKHS